PVSFNASSSSDSDGKIVSYTWYVNDEKIGNGRTMERVLDTGNHEITLTVRDNDGATSSDTVHVKSVDHSIGLNVQEEYIEAEEGEEGVFHIKVHNLAEVSDNIRMSADVQVEFVEAVFTIGPNSERTITMKVRATRDTEIYITAWAGQYSFYTTAVIKVAQVYDVDVQITPPSKNALTGAPGTTVNFILVVTNEGTGDDTITISSESSQPWQVSIDKISINLHSGTSNQVIVRVTLPETAAKGESIQVKITALSKDGETSSTFTLTATVIASQDQTTPKEKDDDSPGFEAFVLIAGLVGVALVNYYRKRRKRILD
ncbi:MAG: PKD domain-containing protein, partial [Thermoplasmata archaeon]|nr:PKD domain-containing protein [Thermoplasmata archaeon]